jgi:hypothetical protein
LTFFYILPPWRRFKEWEDAIHMACIHYNLASSRKPPETSKRNIEPQKVQVHMLFGNISPETIKFCPEYLTSFLLAPFNASSRKPPETIKFCPEY